MSSSGQNSVIYCSRFHHNSNFSVLLNSPSWIHKWTLILIFKLLNEVCQIPLTTLNCVGFQKLAFHTFKNLVFYTMDRMTWSGRWRDIYTINNSYFINCLFCCIWVLFKCHLLPCRPGVFMVVLYYFLARSNNKDSIHCYLSLILYCIFRLK